MEKIIFEEKATTGKITAITSIAGIVILYIVLKT